MCGLKPCKSCEAKSRKRSSKLNGISMKKKFSKPLNTAVGAGAGLIAANMLNNVSFVASNPLIGNIAKIGLGVYLASSQKGMLGSAGLGIAASGVYSAAKTAIPGIGYLPPVGSTSVHSVAGTYNYGPAVVVD